MDKDQIHKEWVKHPTGKIDKGGFCDDCKRFNVRNCTVQIIPIKENKILLQKRNLNPEKGSWAMVAGYVGWDETLEEGMKREMMEEMGLKIESLELFNVYSDPKRDKDGRQNIAVVYVGEVSGEMKIDPYEVEEGKWFDLDNLPESIAFDHREIIDDYVKAAYRHGCCGGGGC